MSKGQGCRGRRISDASAECAVDASLPSVDALFSPFKDLEKQRPEQPTGNVESSLGKRDEKQLKTIQEAMDKEGGCGARSAAGQLAIRQFTSEEEKAYTKLSDRNKTAFRSSWLKTRYNDLVTKSKQHLESWQIVDETIGLYMSVSKAWMEEGGQPWDIEPTKLMCRKLLQMGTPWSRWNPLTERSDIFYVRITHRERFVQSWTLFSEWQQKRVNPKCAAIEAAPTPAEQQQAPSSSHQEQGQPIVDKSLIMAPQGRGRGGSKRSFGQPALKDDDEKPLIEKKQPLKRGRSRVSITSPRGNADPAGHGQGEDSAKSAKAKTQECEALRRTYFEVTTMARTIQLNMEQDERWKKMKPMSEDMDAAVLALHSYTTQSAFATKLIMTDMRSLKNEIPEIRLSSEIGVCMPAMQPLVDKLQQEVIILMDYHNRKVAAALMTAE